MTTLGTHRQLAAAVRGAAAGPAGLTGIALRESVLARAAGGAAAEAPFDALARQIARSAPGVTDAQVAAVRAAAGSDKAAFEIILTACIGAGLARWDAAARVIEEAAGAAG